jgi:hypothetical protein
LNGGEEFAEDLRVQDDRQRGDGSVWAIGAADCEHFLTLSGKLPEGIETPLVRASDIESADQTERVQPSNNRRLDASVDEFDSGLRAGWTPT